MGDTIPFEPMYRPRYYVAVNSPSDGFSTYYLTSLAATAAEVERLLASKAEDPENAPCVFLLVTKFVETGPCISFLHADRFLDAVRTGEITEEIAWQTRAPIA